MVMNNTVNSNKYHGIRLENSNNNTLTNNTASSNNDGGIELEKSSNNMVMTNTVNLNKGEGICLESSSHSNTITNNTALNNNYGIRLESSSDNFIYNNCFSNTYNAYDDGNNIWNITQTLGTNVIGGPFLGGNYWSDYTAEDLNGDGLGDTMLPYNSSENIQKGGDYLPLVPTAPPPLPVHNLNTGEDFSTIQAAIDAANTTDGHTITVYPGTYNENVKVNKPLTIRSSSGNPADTIVNAPNPNDHVLEVTADYVSISGFTVKGAIFYKAGIYIGRNVDHCNISDNNASNNDHGIYLSFFEKK